MGEPEIMTDYIYDATSEAALNISVSAASTATSAVTVSASADVMLPYLMPQAEYMYGCTATAIGMLLGYYDLYGYLGYDVTNLFNGTVELNSRGLDGDPSNMNSFDTLMGSTTANRTHVSNYFDVTPEHELQYSFVDGGTVFSTSDWSCIADFLGTNQYWRGNEDYSTTYYFDVTLADVLDWNDTLTISSGDVSRTIDARYAELTYGLSLYAEYCGYLLDAEHTGNFVVDTYSGYSGDFTFEDYMAEIDAGRGVIIQIDGHSMVGYGYNESTREIIFDDTYESGQRMTWGGTYNYSGANREIIAITVVAFETGSLRPFDGPVGGYVVADITKPTNGNVTLNAYYSSGATEKLYSFDGETWFNYPLSGGIEVIDNRTVYFRSLKQDGEVLDDMKYNVTNIDRVPPDNPVITPSTTELTSKNVVLTAEFSADSSVRQYSLDGFNWKSYLDSGVQVTANGVVYFRAFDEAGNASDTVAYLVENIDKSVPDAPRVYADIESMTNQDVTLTAIYPETAEIRQYSFNGADWFDYTGGVVMSANGTVYFRAFNANGASSEVVRYVVSNIDRLPPMTPVITPSTSAPTAENVVITAEFSSDSTRRQYSLDGVHWRNYNANSGVVMSGNGTVYFRASDAAGNWSEISTIEVSNINRTVPAEPWVYASTEDPTNQDVTVYALFAADAVVREYSFNGREWFEYDENAGVEMKENGDIIFRGTTVSGVTSLSEYTVANIDRVAPWLPNVVQSTDLATDGTVQLQVEYPADAVIYEYSTDGFHFTRYNGPISVDKNGLYYFRSIDAAGNMSDTLVHEVDNIHPDYYDTGSGMFSGAVGLGNDRSDQFAGISISLGSYMPVGEFGILNGKITIYNDRGKRAASWTIKNGVIKGSEKLFEAGVYTVEISDSSKGKRASEYYFQLGGSVFSHANQQRDDNWQTLEAAAVPVLSVDTPVADEWVGFGDSIDYRRLVLDGTGSYSLTIDGAFAGSAVVTVWELSSKTGKLKKKKTLTVSQKKKGVVVETSKVLSGLLLEEGVEYYVSVSAKSASSGRNVAYSLDFERLDNWVLDNADDDWQKISDQSIYAYELDRKSTGFGISDGFVGFGDDTDYRKIEIASGVESCSFNFSGDGSKLKLTVYSLTSKGKLKAVKSVSLSSKTTSKSMTLSLDEGTYFAKITAPSASKGNGGAYSLNVNATFAPEPEPVAAEAWTPVAVAATGDKLLTGVLDASDPFDSFDIAPAVDSTLRWRADEETALAVDSGELALALRDSSGTLLDLVGVEFGVWESASAITGGSGCVFEVGSRTGNEREYTFRLETLA